MPDWMTCAEYGLDHVTDSGSRLYSDIERRKRTGELRALLRVVSVKYKGKWIGHLREFYPDDYGVKLLPGKGASFSLNELDRIIYGLTLMKLDWERGRLLDDEWTTDGGEGALKEQEPSGQTAGQVAG